MYDEGGMNGGSTVGMAWYQEGVQVGEEYKLDSCIVQIEEEVRDDGSEVQQQKPPASTISHPSKKRTIGMVLHHDH